MTVQALVFLLVSVCYDSPSLGVLAGVSVQRQSPGLSILAGVIVF